MGETANGRGRGPGASRRGPAAIVGPEWRARLRPWAGIALPLFTAAGLCAASVRIAVNGYADMGLYLMGLATARRILLYFLLHLAIAAPLGLAAGLLAERRSRQGTLPAALMLLVLSGALAAALAVTFRPTPYWSTRGWEILKEIQRALGPLGSLITRRAFRLGALALLSAAAAAAFFAASLMLLRRPAVARRIERLLRPERLSTIQRSAMLLSLAAIVVVTGGSLAADALRRPGGPNVLLITIDTLRADHLGIYGRFREPAPHLAALAARGTLFTNAVAQAPWTLPSIASLQTGLYPREHGAIYPDLRVGEPRTILSEYLRDAGYATAVVSSWLFVSKAHGFAQGVDRFEWLRPSEGEREMPAPEITGRGVRLLREMAGKPFYLWLHYVEPHTPYLDHEEWDFAGGYDGPLEGDIDITRLYRERNSLTSADLDHVRDLYDEEIAFMDRQIGVLLDELDRLGLRETTMIVVAGDHGEEFQERGGFGHHHQVYQEVIRVPLIIVEPAGESIGTPDQQAERVVDRVVEIREVARTILTRCGISAPEVPGNGLLHELPAGEAIVAVSEHFDRWKRIERNIAVIGTGWKMIENVPAGSFELYDLGTDPGETIDLAASTDPVAVEAAARLSRALRELRLTGSTEPSSAPLSEEERDRMRSLGYLE